jgi:hypothetical protein
MSKIVVGFTNAATGMMGEKGADMIINQSQVSSSDESNAKDELGNLFILCNLSCDIYFHNKNGFRVLILFLLKYLQYYFNKHLCPTVHVSFHPSFLPHIGVFAPQIISK